MKGEDNLDRRCLEQINELLDSSQLNFFQDIPDIVRERFSDINGEDIEEFRNYVKEFVECCIEYGDILANQFKVPFLPRDDRSKREIGKYIVECQKKYPEIEEKHIRGIFSTVCWLANR